MGGMEVCQPPQPGQGDAGGGGMGGGVGGAGDPGRSSSTTPGHRDRTLVYSTVGTPDYIAPEVRCFFLLRLVVVCLLVCNSLGGPTYQGSSYLVTGMYSVL